jgi:hypothetical protein
MRCERKFDADFLKQEIAEQKIAEQKISLGFTQAIRASTH